MIFSRGVVYTIQALVELAKHPKGLTVAELAQQTNLSRPFLAKLLQQLSREGILASSKGAKGGFVLNKRPEEIKIGELFRLIDGKGANLFYCIEDGNCLQNRSSRCQTGRFVIHLNQQLFDLMNRYTLQSILEEEYPIVTLPPLPF
jgi:Rrf2 family protein